MRILMICGSRGYANPEQVKKWIQDNYVHYEVLIHGNCPNSPDVWADEEAKKHPFIIGRFNFPSAFGKRGGPMRNKVMVKMADTVVAFWDGNSRGTEMVIEYARKLGKPVEVISSGLALRKGLNDLPR